MSVAESVLRQRALRELDLGLIIPNGDITAFGATSITAANSLRNSLWAPTRFADLNTVIYRGGAASSADWERFAGSLTITTGELAHTGANYSDTTVGSEVVELWHNGVRPSREVRDSLNRVLATEFVTSMHMLNALSLFDSGMEASTDTNWTDVGTPTTSAKTTTQTHQILPVGTRGYTLVGDATGEGTRPTNGAYVRQGGTVSAFAIVAASAGTASFQLYDQTNSADIGTAVTHSEIKPMLVAIRNQTVPATCKRVTLSMLGSTNPATIVWNQVGIYPHYSTMFQLPSFISESFMAPRLYVGRPKYQVATDVWDAESMEYVPLTEHQDYRLVMNHSDAEPYKVQLINPSFDWPIFVEYRRSLNSIEGNITDDTNTVNGVTRTILPKFKKDLLETVYAVGAKRHKDWDRQYNFALEQIRKTQAARPILAQGPVKPYYSTRNLY